VNPLLEQFLEEARENLAFIEQNLESLGDGDAEMMNSIFRAAHTLKGGSGIVGFESVKEITHHAEDLLDMLRSDKIEFQPSMLDVLYDAFDEVVNLIEAAEESADIVDADEDTVSRLIELLSAEMGKNVEVEAAWVCPYTAISSVQDVINVPMPFLQTTSQKLAFDTIETTQESCAEAQLYVVTFDIDESCMVYGNDPVYTLSLLEDKVLGVFTCMSDDSAKSILSGMDDEDGLLLRTQITAYIYATYLDIEDALFNFLDELSFLVLDITTLLSISSGEAGSKLDVLKDCAAAISEHISGLNRDAIFDEIDKTIKLIGSETLQYAQLLRLKGAVNLSDDNNLKRLTPYLNALYKGEVFSENMTLDESDVVSSVTTSETASSTQTVENVTAIVDITPQKQEHIKVILDQQLTAVTMEGGDQNVERVGQFLQTLRPYYPSMPQNFSTVDNVVSCIKALLSGESVVIADETPSVKPVEVQTPVAVTPTIVEPIIEATVAPVVTEPEVAVTPISSAPKSVEVVTPVVEESETAVTKAAKPAKEAAKKSVIGKVVKIEQDSIDSLMNIVGELLVAKNSLPYLADNVIDMNSEEIKRSILEKYTFINRLSEQLQDLIMSMRMLPISYVFDRYPKLVRDISKNMSKKVNLTMSGGDTKLDKNMIEMLADPMIHIMRNSLDHGIEMPELRKQKGKSEFGEINLKAYSQSDKIIIEIIDDGAGINVDRVITKVLEKELLTMDQIDALSDNEKAELVLLPGLSTVEVISEYSGRGVGMDVVKTSLENFGGTINIETKPNVGTTITLSIPVSLAVSSLLHVSMDSIHYGFPMESVAETVKIEREEIEYLHNEPFVYLRGEVIPLLMIDSMLNSDDLQGKPLSIVVLSIKGNLLAVVVNELLGQLDVVQKPLEGLLNHHPIFSGTALLGNGQIIMAIDPLGLLSLAHSLKSSNVS
jgi:two-component system chemotaxis sensor kinase CheA